MTENRYQAKIIRKLRTTFPGCVVLKLDSSYQQGIPDLLILCGRSWAALEVKADLRAPEQPNQRYFVEKLEEMSYAAFLFPENEDAIFHILERLFRRDTE